MRDPMTLLLAGGAGVLLGVLFFGGLWWTVQRGLVSRRPALWFVGSFLLRTSVVLAGITRTSLASRFLAFTDTTRAGRRFSPGSPGIATQ